MHYIINMVNSVAYINFFITTRVLYICASTVSDINECSDDDSNGCNHVCTNTDGSYTCYCNTGYELGIDQKTCVGMYCIS